MANRLIDLTAQRFGLLTVVERVANDPGGRARWLCRCDCGKSVEAAGGSLRMGQSSCGCDWNRTTIEDMTGQRFGRLVVVAPAPNRSRRRRWSCKCDCGETHTTTTNLLRAGLTWKCQTACLLKQGRRQWPRHPQYWVGEDGSIAGSHGELLNTTLNTAGYPQIVNGGWSERVHVIVCETFHGPRPKGMQAAHENGVPTDCRAANLSWKTPAENSADKIRHGTDLRGEQVCTAKLTEGDIREIRAAYAAGEQQRAIAARYGVTHPNIGYIVRRETWRHVA